MTRRPLLIVTATLLVALTLLVLVGQRVLERDRADLFDGYGARLEQVLEEAARGVAGEVTEIGEDLDLASILIQNDTNLAERELHAIATIKREYLVMYARTGAETVRVSAYDAPAGAAALADASLERLLRVAEEEPGKLHVSTALADAGPASWYRVFAKRTKRGEGPVVAVAVDTAVLLTRMKLQRDPMARTLIVDANGAAAAASDRVLAAQSENRSFAPLVASVRRGEKSRGVIGNELAHRIGLPNADAIVVAVPLVVDGGRPWALLVTASTQALQTQEQTIVRRVIVGSALVLVLLLSAAAYVLHNTFRARGLRERVKHLTEMRRIEQRLLHSEKLVTAGQLAAGIAHEIGTPLNVARGRVELVLSHLGADHRDADSQRVVIDQIDRVTRLIQNLLDYVRPAPPAIRAVDLAQALQGVRDLLAPQAAKRNVSLEVTVSPDASTLQTDPDQIQQILVNLTLNAIDACAARGKVTLRASRRDDAVVLEVTDDGHGIERDLQKQVFDPFFTTKKRGQGTGLGLWVVAQLVRAQSAEIELESTPGTGTTVRVAWPVVA